MIATSVAVRYGWRPSDRMVRRARRARDRGLTAHDFRTRGPGRPTRREAETEGATDATG